MMLFQNNQLKHANEAMVSIFDHGFLYGIGLFETFRTYNGKPFLLTDHLNRLEQSCHQIGISYTIREDELRNQIVTLLVENKLSDAYFRLTISAGEGELGLPTADYEEPTIILMAKLLPVVKTEAEWNKGKAAVCLQTRRNTPESAIRFKSLHYMNNIIAKREMRLNYPDKFASVEGLMLNDKGELTEGIVSNVFFRIGNTIYTPAIGTGILPGITRAYVIALCNKAGYLVEEGYYTWNHLLIAEEIWLTNSIQEITPVTTIISENGVEKLINNGVVGDYTKQLYDRYKYDSDQK